MPRNRGGAGRAAPRPAPSRPTVVSSGPKQQQPGGQERSSSSLAATSPHGPSAGQSAQSGSSSGGGGAGGLMANVASTAAGVAIGHSIGNAISSMFGGSESTPDSAPDSAASAPSTIRQDKFGNNIPTEGPCSILTKEFTQCLDQNGSMGPCQWLFDQLKLCQQANRDL